MVARKVFGPGIDHTGGRFWLAVAVEFVALLTVLRVLHRVAPAPDEPIGPRMDSADQVTAVLDGIPGAHEAAARGSEAARRGDVIALADLGLDEQPTTEP